MVRGSLVKRNEILRGDVRSEARLTPAPFLAARSILSRDLRELKSCAISQCQRGPASLTSFNSQIFLFKPKIGNKK